MLLKESLLQRMELTVLFQALDRQHLAPIGLNCEQGAGFDCLAIEYDRTGATVARIAADMCACEPKVLAKEVHQKQSRLDFCSLRSSVDSHVDTGLGHY